MSCRKEDGNLDLRDGWEAVFGTGVDARTLVIRPDTLGAGRTYTFSLSATDAYGNIGYAGKLCPCS